MSKFEEALAQKKFVVTVGLDPPKGVDLAGLEKLANSIDGRVDALFLSDNRGAVLRQSPLIAAQLLQQQGLETGITLTCRDRNRLALTSDLLAAAAAGIGNVLLVSGDFVSLGDNPEAKPVYDLDSIQALLLAGELAKGRDPGGNELEGPVKCLAGSTISMGSDPMGPQVIKFQKKVKAGAAFFVTRPLADLDRLKKFLEMAGPFDAKLLVGVEAETDEDMDSAAGQVKRIKESGLADGVHLAMPDRQEHLPELMDKCGL